jgi:hypothetical protein
MDEDSSKSRSDAAGAAPGSLLAQPPLQGESTPGQEGGSGQGDQESMRLLRLRIIVQVLTELR